MDRILIVGNYYESYLRSFYNRHPGLGDKPYAEQKMSLDYDSFGWVNGMSRALMSLDYEVQDVIANNKPSQEAWARENNHIFPSKNWLWDVSLAQINKFQPRILMMNENYFFNHEWISAARKICPSISLVLGWCGAPYSDLEIIKSWDVVLSCIPEMVQHFRELGLNCVYMNHGFDAYLLERLGPAPAQDIDLSFVGNILRRNNFHNEREKLLINLASQIPIKIFAPNTDYAWKAALKMQAKVKLYDLMEALKSWGISQSALAAIPKIGKAALWMERPRSPVIPELKSFMKPAVYGLDMYQTLRRSKITLNSHIDISKRSASNMRLFEATGVGACLVTDWKENLGDLFQLEKEVVTYKSPAECVEKVKWLLANPRQREAIARAGQKRTLADHTFANRAGCLDEIIKSLLKFS